MVRDALLRNAPHHEIHSGCARTQHRPHPEERAQRASRRTAPRSGPWFETRCCATLLTMRSIPDARAPNTDLILRSERSERLEGWPQAPPTNSSRVSRIAWTVMAMRRSLLGSMLPSLRATGL